MTKQLEDPSPMPFGTHEGKQMQDVPARYLCWLWNESDEDQLKHCPVRDYIRRNMSALHKEYPDGIWTN